ncbi:hypothetical protein [Vibrio hangzhouensis]|nr:hypothetical protein [Vibrio hangzhouensis]MBY6199236.1 hypothetical protein [Vibrio hangzhouensis]
MNSTYVIYLFASSEVRVLGGARFRQDNGFWELVDSDNLAFKHQIIVL